EPQSRSSIGRELTFGSRCSTKLLRDLLIVNGRTDPVCARAACPGSGRAHSSRPANNPHQAGPPSRFARTTAGANATRCPDRSADSTPRSARCDANTSLRASPASERPRSDPARAAHKDGKRANTRPTGADDATPSHRAEPATHNPWHARAGRVRQETAPVAVAVG